MVVVHVACFHRPTDPRVFHKECRELAHVGHDVRLAAVGAPDEPIDGVRFIRLPEPKRRSLAGQLVEALRNCRRVTKTTRPDAYHFHEADMLPVMLFARLRGTKVIYDVHEDAPRQVVSRCKSLGVGWAGRPVSIYYRMLEWLGKRLFDAFICATPSIAKRFPAERTVTVCNYPRLEEFDASDAASSTPYRQRPNRIVYAGGLTRMRGVIEILRAMELLSADLRTALDLAGTFAPESLERQARAEPGWRRVRYHGWLGRPDLASVLAQARVGLVILHPRPNYLDAFPTKMYEYMASGIPVIASDFPLWRSIVEDAGCGLLVDPTDPQAIAEAIAWMLRHPREAEAMGRRGREAAEARYNWAQERAKLLEVYRSLAVGPAEKRASQIDGFQG